LKQRFLALGCAASLAVSLLAGCQSVGGVELDKVVHNALGVSSYEGTSSMTLKLTTAESLAGYPDFTLLNNLQVSLTEVKQQDKTHSSAKGVLRSGASTIPFQIAAADKDVVLKVDGAAKPLTIGSKADVEAEGTPAPFSLDLSSFNWEKLLQDHLVSLLEYMPKLDSLTVSDEKVEINKEALTLKKLHVELKGNELAPIVQTTIANLLADQEGGDALIRAIVKDAGLDPDNSFVIVLVKQALKKVSEDLSALPGGFTEYLNEGNQLKLDLYVDGDSQIRRFGYELGLSGLSLMDGAVTGLTAAGTSDRWNINKTVTADTIASTDAVDLAEAGGLARFVKSLDKDSQAYKLLVKDLKITRKHVVLPPIEDGLPGEDPRPYIDSNNKTLVPVRFVSENLDAEVKWDGDKQQVTVTDILTGKTLVFTIGSKIVSVDGKELELEAAAALTGGSTYVPARFIAESFGAEVSWDPDTRVVSIIRD
jgi:hypothetical protein